MKHFRQFCSKYYAALVSAVLGLLGLSTSCDDINNEFPPAEYGCPYAEYAISGRVTSTESGEPIKGIKVVNKTSGDSIYTNEEGYYNLEGGNVFVQSVEIKVEDIDSIENGGEFSPKDLVVSFSSSDFKDGKGWYQGKAEKVEDIELNKK